MVIAKSLLFYLTLTSLLYAITMLEPYKREISNGEEIHLGSIGPGQTISISLDGRPKTGGLFGVGGAYEYAVVSELPEGWSAQNSDWAGIPLNVKIKADKRAPEGEYKIRIDVLDEDDKEKLGNITFFVKINITHDVFDGEVDEVEKEIFSEQPARFYITITNKANTGDVFSISSTNIPKWTFKKSIYVPPRSSKTIYYEVVSSEEEKYFPQIFIVSESSSMLNKTLNVSVSVNPSLPVDMKATNNGMLFFPAMNGIIYALAGFISNLF